jgi:MoxR-like ATPase
LFAPITKETNAVSFFAFRVWVKPTAIMEIKMLFNQINIYGWDDIEPVILAAIVSELPVLLIGDIGSNKTEGAEAISRAVLGAKIDFRAYEVPTLNFDDLIGFMNPKSLARGELDFVHTPLSIWKADAVLFDEINRANPNFLLKLMPDIGF